MCRPPQSEVPPDAVWEEPKTEENDVGGRREEWVSVLVAQFALGSLWVPGRPNITTPSFVPFRRSAAFFL